MPYHRPSFPPCFAPPSRPLAHPLQVQRDSRSSGGPFAAAFNPFHTLTVPCRLPLRATPWPDLLARRRTWQLEHPRMTLSKLCSTSAAMVKAAASNSDEAGVCRWEGFGADSARRLDALLPRIPTGMCPPLPPSSPESPLACVPLRPHPPPSPAPGTNSWVCWGSMDA
jgi:hypothetical protein